MKKQDMLKKNKEFRFVVSRGKSVSSPYMVLICARSRTGKKLGFSVSAKLGNAVVRNRTKRVMRAGVTPLLPVMKQNTAYLFIVRRGILGKKSTFVQEKMLELLKEAGVLNEGTC